MKKKRKIRLFTVGLFIVSLPACRTGPVWQGAKKAICDAHAKVEGSLNALAGPFGLPGTVAAGLLNAGIGLVCGAAGVAADAGSGVTGAVIDSPAEAVGIIAPVPKSP